MKSAAKAVLSTLIVAAGYLALSARFTPGEWVLAAVSVLLYRLAMRALPPVPSISAPPRQTVPGVPQILGDTARLLACSIRRPLPAGKFLHCRVASPPARATAILALSIAPNAYAVDEEGEGLRVHRLTGV